MSVWRFLGLVLLAVVGVVALAVWVFPVTADFYLKNPFWNGLQDFLRQYDVTSLSSTEDLPENPTNTVLIVIPYQSPTGDDVGRIESYLHRGGTVVLADDYGFGNVILEGLGLEYRFSGTPLLDPLFNYRNEWFPLGTEMSPSPLTAGVSSLALNYGTALEAEGATTIVRSSAFSYLDLNNNETRDTDEPVGPFVIVARGSVSSGRLILVSDPSIFINCMEEAEDNARFVSNLVESAGDEGRVFLLESLLPPSNLVGAKSGLAWVREFTNRSEVLTALTAFLVVALLYPVWKKRGGSPWTRTN